MAGCTWRELMLVRENHFLRDGTFGIVVGFICLVGTEWLNKKTGIICELPGYVFDFMMRPIKHLIILLSDSVLSISTSSAMAGGPIKVNWYVGSALILADIALLAAYWFLLGSMAGLLWRTARAKLRLAFT